MVRKGIKIATVGASIAAGILIAIYGYLEFYPKVIFHLFISFTLIASCGPPALLIHIDERRKRMIDDALPRLLEDVAESQEAGMTLLQALEEASKRKYGPITQELRRLVAQLSWGVELEQAFKSTS